MKIQTPLDLSIIIVNWNSAEFVRRCVDSIRRQPIGLTYEIIVIDNASFDGCDRMLREHHPEVSYVQSHENLGFARANNLAFKLSRGTTLLFLNPDTEIVGSAIQQLHKAASELPSAGVVGARLLNADGTLQTSCIQSFPTIINQVLTFEFLQRLFPWWELWGMAPLYHQPHAMADEVQGISGACMMLRRDVYIRVGCFSEDYFMYTEDLDLCYNTRKSGLKNYYLAEATIIHFGGSSSKQAASDFSCIMMRESIWRFLRKTRGDIYGLGYRCAMFLSAVVRLGLLVFLFPIQALRGRCQRWRGSFREWYAVLRWSVRLSLPSINHGEPSAQYQEVGPVLK